MKSDAVFVAAHPIAGISHLTWESFFVDSLVPVTIGNILGGAVMVGAIYWFVYLRAETRRRAVSKDVPA